MALKPTKYSFLESPKACWRCSCPQSLVRASPTRRSGKVVHYRTCVKCGEHWVSEEPLITAATPFLDRFTRNVLQPL